jgi:hypothetical protein
VPDLFQHGRYEAQMRGVLRPRRPSGLYEESLAARPTAEAHTFLGWDLVVPGRPRPRDRVLQARDRLRSRLSGTPYNDIGAYLIERGALDDAIPWLQRGEGRSALRGPRVPALQPRARVRREGDALGRAARVQEAVTVQAGYEPALRAIAALRVRLN